MALELILGSLLEKRLKIESLEADRGKGVFIKMILMRECSQEKFTRK